MCPLGQDPRHALRQLGRCPAFTGIVILALALGIESTTAIFGVVEAVLLRPLAYPDADRLVRRRIADVDPLVALRTEC